MTIKTRPRLWYLVVAIVVLMVLALSGYELLFAKHLSARRGQKTSATLKLEPNCGTPVNVYAGDSLSQTWVIEAPLSETRDPLLGILKVESVEKDDAHWGGGYDATGTFTTSNGMKYKATSAVESGPAICGAS